jgi:hypothetical protein
VNRLTNQTCDAVDETTRGFDTVDAEIVGIGASGSIEDRRRVVASNPEVQP